MWGFIFHWLIFMMAEYLLISQEDKYILAFALCPAVYWQSWPQHQCRMSSHWWRLSQAHLNKMLTICRWMYGFMIYTMSLKTPWKTAGLQCCCPWLCPKNWCDEHICSGFFCCRFHTFFPVKEAWKKRVKRWCIMCLLLSYLKGLLEFLACANNATGLSA